MSAKLETRFNPNVAAESKNQAVIDEIFQNAEIPIPWCYEYEKMVSGMTFKSANDASLHSFRFSVVKKLKFFNEEVITEESTMDSLRVRRMGIAKELLGKLGRGVNIEIPLFLGWGCNTFIGDDVYINREVSIYDNAPVFIGHRVLIGPGVCICTGTHDTDAIVRREAGGSFAYPIRIEDDCWIGARATILPGVTIGRGSIIAAGAVVSGNVEAHCVAGGVPAKVLKKLEVGEMMNVNASVSFNLGR